MKRTYEPIGPLDYIKQEFLKEYPDCDVKELEEALSKYGDTPLALAAVTIARYGLAKIVATGTEELKTNVNY